MNLLKKIFKPLLLVLKVIFCTFPPLLGGLGWGLFLTSCDDMDDKLKPEINIGAAEPTKLYILSEGLFNLNNSTLASYDLNSKTLVTDFFLTVNKRGLGDTANDMIVEDGYIYKIVGNYIIRGSFEKKLCLLLRTGSNCGTIYNVSVCAAIKLWICRHKER